MNRAIFVSYRRDDAEGEAGRLYDDLTRAFGSGSVFIDVAGIAPGIDFRKAIDDNVAVCGVFLAVIGPRWADIAAANGTRRLDNPSDFVRLEVASALARNVPVIPILVRAAAMPTPEQLPGNIQDLAYRNALELSHTRWSTDVGLLITALQPYVQAPSEPSPAEIPVPAMQEPQGTTPSPSVLPNRSRFTRTRVALAAAALCLLLAVYPLYRFLSRPKPSPPATASRPAAQPPDQSPVKTPASQPVTTQGADREVAQIQQTLSAAAGSPAKAGSPPTAAPELPFRKGPPLAAGDIDGTWTSQAPGPDSFANKIVISGSGRYRTLYILGSCGKQGFEFTTPDADFVHGFLTEVYSCPNWATGESESKIYYTMYLTARGLFMHAESRLDKAMSGSHSAPVEEIGYYDNASSPDYVAARAPKPLPTAPKIPFANGPPQLAGDINGTWTPLSPETSGLAFKIVIEGENRSLYVEGQLDRKPFSYNDHGGTAIIDGKLTAIIPISGTPKGAFTLQRSRDSKIYYTMYLTAKGLFVHAERWLDPPQPGQPNPVETQDGLYRQAPAPQND